MTATPTGIAWSQACDMRTTIDRARTTPFPEGGLNRDEQREIAKANALLDEAVRCVMRVQGTLSTREKADGRHNPPYRAARAWSGR